MSKKQIDCLKVAVVGGGAFGEIHLHTLKGMPQVEIGGVYTLERERGEELCAKYGGTNYESLQALVEDPSIDLVTIATPEHSHFEPFKAAAAHGKAIYVEKPLASSLAEAQEMIALSKDIIAMSGHCMRFEQRVAYVFDKLQGVPKQHLSFRDRRTRDEKAIYGRVHPAYCMLCHEIELSNAFAEAPFKRVMAMETRFSEGQVDGITILIEYENGVTSSVEGGWYLPSQKNISENDFISIRSEAGIDEMSMPHTGYYRVTESGVETPNLYYGNSVYGTEYGLLRSAFDYMVRCIISGEKPQISTLEDGYNAVELIEAALRSVAENRWISRSEVQGS